MPLRATESGGITAEVADVLHGRPGELLAHAVARLILRTRLAPGIVATTFRYVLRAAGCAAGQFLPAPVVHRLLPCQDHLASLGRMLAQLLWQYDHVEAPPPDMRFQLVRGAFLAYNYKSRVYRELLAPATAAGLLPATSSGAGDWLHAEVAARKAGRADGPAMKNRHAPQGAACYEAWDKRLCARATPLAAAEGEQELLRLLRTPLEKGGAAAGSAATLVGTRVPAILSMATGAVRAYAPTDARGAEVPMGGAGSEQAMGQHREGVAQHVRACAALASDAAKRARLEEAAAEIRALDLSELARALFWVLHAEPAAVHRLVPGLLPPGCAAWAPAVRAALPQAYSPGACELLWCEYGHRFEGTMRGVVTHMPKYDDAKLEALLPCSTSITVPFWRGELGCTAVARVELAQFLPSEAARAPPAGGPCAPEHFLFTFAAPPAQGSEAEWGTLPPLEPMAALRGLRWGDDGLRWEHAGAAHPEYNISHIRFHAYLEVKPREDDGGDDPAPSLASAPYVHVTETNGRKALHVHGALCSGLKDDVAGGAGREPSAGGNDGSDGEEAAKRRRLS